MENYDIAIIGTGPAGLSAAITAKVRKKSVLLIGSASSSDKVAKAHTISNYLGLPDVGGSDLSKAFLGHVKSMGIDITEEKVTLIYPMGDYFSMQGSSGEIYNASTVILATGVVAGKPFPGETEFLGSGVSYCATCDAALYKGKSVAIVGFSPKEEAEADFMTEYAASVTYIPMYKEEPKLKEGIKVLREKPLSISGSRFTADTLTTDAGEHSFDGIFILRESVSPGQLVPGLELEEPHVKVDRQMKTNIPGCFACGDIAGKPYQYIKAAGEGNVAALSAVSYLDAKRREDKND
jgi:thioredoxin reductase (NADPH)